MTISVPLTTPSIQQADIDNVVRVLQSGNLVQGQQVQALETAVADFVGVKHAVAVANGTASLHLALLSLGVRPGDEVIVPAFSYVATANVVELVGARPVFVDICLKTFNLDSAHLGNAISSRTKAIIPVHEFGYPADMESILGIANRHGIPVIEDAACALGSEWKSKKIGALGLVGSFSLHPRKAITSGEGGLLTTDDDHHAEFFRRQRNHGIYRSDARVEFVSAGFNYRMTDIQAALVIGQFERLADIASRRTELANRYNNNLIGNCFSKPTSPTEGKTSWQSYHIVLNDDVDRDQFFNFVKARRIEVSYGAQCIPVVKFYRDKYSYEPHHFPNAFRAYAQGVVLPLFDQMSLEQSEYVIQSVNEFFEV